MGTSASLEEEFVGNFLAALYNRENIANRFKSKCTDRTEELQIGRRDSITIKVAVPSTSDLWKFWVPKIETLEDFKARAAERVGADVELFTDQGIAISTEEEWRLVDAEHKVIAKPV